MGDYNWSLPTTVGPEWNPYVETTYLASSASGAIVDRFKPGALTITAIHREHPLVVGTPGYALEIVDTLMPTMTNVVALPGTDTGASYTGWQTQASGAGTFSVVNSQTNNSTYLRNVSALNPNTTLQFTTRGGNSALSGQRIAYVALWSYQMLFSFSNTVDCGVEAVLNIAGQNYYGPVRRLPNNLVWYTTLQGIWPLNPSTSLPWTQADVNNLITTAGTDEYGVRISTPQPAALAAASYHCAGVWLDVHYAPENRKGFYYSSQRPVQGWSRYLLSSPSVLNANQYYWMVEYPLLGSTGAYFSSVVHTDPNVVVASAASASLGEHRQILTATLTNGIVTSVFPDYRTGSQGTTGGQAVTAGVPGALLGGVLYENSGGTFLTQSNPYSLLERRKIATDSAANIGQQISIATTNVAYGAVALPLAWHRAGVRPDRELTIEIRHGAGSLTGGGTLDATATIRPADISGQLGKYQVNLNAAFTAGANQYFALIKSSASAATGWDVIRLDTLSNQLTGVSTTAAQVEGTSIGTTTDAYSEAGVTSTRYDLVVELISAPTTPVLTVTSVAAVAGIIPPKFLLSWTSIGLGSSFKQYTVKARPTRLPVQPWTTIAVIDVGTGQTAATVEANHNGLQVLDCGWSATGNQWQDGWDFAVTVTHATTGLESAVGTSTGNKLTADTVSWFVSTASPWLNTQVRATSIQEQDKDAVTQYAPLGRDLAVTRAREELPSKTSTVPFNLLQSPSMAVGEDPMRIMRAVAASGRQTALLLPQGDRYLGVPSATQITQQVGELPAGQFTFIETDRVPNLTDYNLPCGTVLNGTSQFWTTADDVTLDPASGAFTIVVAAVFGGSGTTKYALSKGNGGTADGYYLRSTGSANQMQFFVDGATTSGGPIDSSSVWFDGQIHVAVCTSDGTTQKLYRDGALVATSLVTHGAIANAIGLVLGANNAGGSAFMAMTGQSWGYWPRVMTATEALAASYYLLGGSSYRMPSGASVFYDTRDDRCWNSLMTGLNDLGPNAFGATATAAPSVRGLPWPLADLDVF